MATRAGTYPRRQAKEATRRSLKKNWWRLALMSLVPAAVSALILILWPEWTLAAWPLPLALWALVLGTGWSQVHGTYALEAGADAEVWTSKELAKLREGGAQHFDHLLFDYRDVDHVVVHPSGTYVIETKYTDRHVDLVGGLSEPMMRDWRRHVVDRVDRIRALIVLSNRVEVEITPIVVVWGPRIEGISKTIEGVLVVRGRELVGHLEMTTPSARLDLQKQKSILAALQRHIDRNDQHVKNSSRR